MPVPLEKILKAFSTASGRWVRFVVVTICAVTICVWLSTNAKTFAGGENSIPVTLGSKNDAAANEQTEPAPAGTNAVPAKIKILNTIDTALLPGETQKAPNGAGRRLIFIGDIHGCYDELMSLLAKVEYNEARDHIIATGDMVNKGPASAAVVDFLIAKKASCVRGNHDDHILSKVAQLEELDNDRADFDDPGMSLAATLTKAQVQYLESCPIILDLGSIPVHGRFVVVHGGLVPSLELHEQDPWAVMYMRIIHQITHVPSAKHNEENYVTWSDLWNREQMSQRTEDNPPTTSAKTMLPSHRDMTVVYGHDARKGLQIKSFTKGLDSNCVGGKELTALILSDQPGQQVVQVKCKQYRV